MTPLRVLVCTVGLLVALAPMAASAQDLSAEHLAAELANANAQMQEAMAMADAVQAEAQLSAANDRMIAVLESEELRQHQLDNSANGKAIEQITGALARAARLQGEVNALNELGIAQIRAAALVAKADDTLANAMAQGRPNEIANAQAQSKLLRSLADSIASVQAEASMSSARLHADEVADVIHTPGIAEAANASAMGANDLFAADEVLAEGQIDATSSLLTGAEKAAGILSHATLSLENARAMSLLAAP
jgi:hypothetical protein